ERLGQLQAQALDVVREVLDGENSRLEYLRGMNDDLVHLGYLDCAILDERRLAGEHRFAHVDWRIRFTAASREYTTRSDAATARSATARHATVRNGNLIGTQDVEQVVSRTHVERALQRQNGYLHDASVSGL